MLKFEGKYGQYRPYQKEILHMNCNDYFVDCGSPDTWNHSTGDALVPEGFCKLK